MPDRGVLIFTYDGSFDGLLCVVFDCFVMKSIPAEVRVFGDMEPTLLKIHTVETEDEHARRVENAIIGRLGESALAHVRKAFLYGEGGKEIAIINYLWKGFNEGKKALSMIADKDINPLFKMAAAVGNEAHMLLGFTRFSDSNGALLAVIHPKHFVLPLLKGYFCSRMYNETFMIYDETHGAALIHSGKNTAIIPLESLEKPDKAEDAFYRDLWKSYYKHIAIDSRYNPTCRQSHMPKRFWMDLPEVADELESSYKPALSRGTAEDIKDRLNSEKQNSLPEQ